MIAVRPAQCVVQPAEGGRITVTVPNDGRHWGQYTVSWCDGRHWISRAPLLTITCADCDPWDFSAHADTVEDVFAAILEHEEEVHA